MKFGIEFRPTNHGRTELINPAQYTFDRRDGEGGADEAASNLNVTNNPAWQGVFAVVELAAPKVTV